MGKATAQRRNTQIVEATLSGQVTPEDIVEMHRLLQKLLDQAPAVLLLVDTSELTGFSPQVRVPGVPFLQAMKRAGIQLVVAIAPNVFARMTGTAIALAANQPIEFVKDRGEAEAAIAKHLAR